MSTRSNIAIEDPKTKKVKVIYVHSDGYPYGVGHMLVDNYNRRELAELLFEHGDASYLDETIDQCSFYHRDWNREIDVSKTYRDEWMYMYDMRGENMIEYIYLFKDNRWHVSTSEYINEKKLKNSYDGGVHYWTKFEPVTLNKEYIKHKDTHEKHAEVKMISQIGKALSGQFPTDDIMMQGAAMKKKN
jgi:hypothetical protein